MRLKNILTSQLTWFDLGMSTCLTSITLWGTSIASRMSKDISSYSFDIWVLEPRILFICLDESKKYVQVAINSQKAHF